jgi:hypothetical protein
MEIAVPDPEPIAEENPQASKIEEVEEAEEAVPLPATSSAEISEAAPVAVPRDLSKAKIGHWLCRNCAGGGRWRLGVVCTCASAGFLRGGIGCSSQAIRCAAASPGANPGNDDASGQTARWKF